MPPTAPYGPITHLQDRPCIYSKQAVKLAVQDLGLKLGYTHGIQENGYFYLKLVSEACTPVEAHLEIHA
jgi:hypothetical protein